MEKDVHFVEEPNPEVNDEIDAASRAKYRRYSANIVGSVLTPKARSATITLVPRATEVA